MTEILEKEMFNVLKKEQSVNLVLVKLLSPEYFYVKPNHKEAYIHSRLLALKSYFLEACGINEFKPVSNQSFESFYTFGILSSQTGSKMEDTVYISNSTDGSNLPVKLDLSLLLSYSLFNGQAVAIYGSNPQGNLIIVDKIIYLPCLNLNQPNKSNTFNKMERNTSRMPFKMEVAKGPFTPNSLQKTFAKQASLYILMGPFVFDDLLIYDLKDDQTAKKTFNQKENVMKLDDFINSINNYLLNLPKSKVLLVPSLDDKMSVQVFPQPKIKIKQISNNIISCTNPCYFYVNNHLVSICNFDNLIDLAADEISKNDTQTTDDFFKTDRLTRLSKYLVFQHSFVPSLNSLSEVIYGDWLKMDVAPDLYFISSKMKLFECKAGPTTLINISSNISYSISTHKNLSNYDIEVDN